MNRIGVRKIASAGLSYGVVALVMWLLYRSVGKTGAVSEAVGGITVTEVVVVCALGLLYLASMLRPMAYTLPGLTTAQAGVARTASLALANTVPEGGTVATGLTFAMYRSWGFRAVDSTTSIITVGIWTNLTRYVLMSIALVILVVFGTGSGSLLWVAVASCVVVAAVCLLIAAIIVDDGFARRVGRLLTRMRNAVARHLSRVHPRDMEQAVSDFRAHVNNRVRTCWRSLTATMLLSQLLGALVLGVAVRMCGIGQDVVGWDRIVVAFGAMWLAAFVAPTPGGLGIAEAALVAVLGAGLVASDQAQLVAAVLLFRCATWLLPIPIGLISYLYWRVTKNWKVPAAQSSVDISPSDLQTRSDDNGSS